MVSLHRKKYKSSYQRNSITNRNNREELSTEKYNKIEAQNILSWKYKADPSQQA